MRWFSEMLLNKDAGELNEEQTEFIENISEANERMIELVNSLLNISRIESGRIIVEPEPTDLFELVNSEIKQLENTIKAAQVTIIPSIASNTPKINIDPKLIREVYKNLLTNAIKYSPKNSEILVLISTKDDQIISQISDNGIGIPQDDQERIFSRFFRAQNARETQTDGSGLGLYLVKVIVESSGGKIWFKSEKNKGTSFWFSLPIQGVKKKEGEVRLNA